jgi:Polyketide cyclase / dehydrase and lipid transport
VAIDVETETTIARPRAEVAAYACDPDNATAWYANIESAEWQTPRPLAVGSRFAFVAKFMGRRLAYVYEVKEHVAGERFVMATTDGGPFAMETTYSWADARDGATLMRLRNRGEPAGFASVLAPLMAPAVRRANRKDLARLKRILEEGA